MHEGLVRTNLTIWIEYPNLATPTLKFCWNMEYDGDGLILFSGKPQVINSFPHRPEPIIFSFPSVRTVISRLGRLRVSFWCILVLVALAIFCRCLPWSPSSSFVQGAPDYFPGVLGLSRLYFPEICVQFRKC